MDIAALHRQRVPASQRVVVGARVEYLIPRHYFLLAWTEVSNPHYGSFVSLERNTGDASNDHELIDALGPPHVHLGPFLIAANAKERV